MIVPDLVIGAVILGAGFIIGVVWGGKNAAKATKIEAAVQYLEGRLGNLERSLIPQKAVPITPVPIVQPPLAG